MPRLSHPKITKGHAIDALLNLYRNDREFACELDRVRDPYLDLIIQFALDSFDSGRKSGLPPKEYFKTAIEHVKNVKKEPPFFPKAAVYVTQLQPYFEALSKLAYRWKLRAPWAVSMLVIYDMCDVLRIEGLVPDRVDVPLEEFDSLYPWSPPLPPLEIKIPAEAVVLQGREKVLAEVKRKLQQYENKIKATGLTEYPSSLQNHAKWWFEHFVRGKKYDDIAQGETYRQEGSLISHAKNVGEAVRKFSRLINIEVKDLK
jgi:hypothetical protein